MKIGLKSLNSTLDAQIKKYQEGGEMPVEQAPAEAEAPVEEQQDPIMQLAQMAAQALQTQDVNMMAQVCQALVELVQQAQPAPEEGAPVYKKGGKLVRYIKK